MRGDPDRLEKKEEHDEHHQQPDIPKTFAGCGCILDVETLGALIPDDEGRCVKAYCNDRKINGFDSYVEQIDAIWLASRRDGRNLAV